MKIKKWSQLIFEFTERKADNKNNENAIDFRWSDVQVKQKEDITMINLIQRTYKIKLIRNFFQHKETGGLFDYKSII